MIEGYGGFFLLLFAPGASLLLLLRQEQGGLVPLLAQSYGLSLVLNSFAGLFGYLLRIPSSDLSLAWLAVVLLAALFSVAQRYGIRFLPALSAELRKSYPVFLVGLAFGVMLLLEFVKYPLFPKSLSADFVQHSQLVDLVLASQGGPGWMLLYGGVHLNLATGVSLVGGSPLIQLPVLMALLTAPSSLLMYEVGRALYRFGRPALLTQALYVITGFVWYVPLYDSGPYPNLYGTILSLFCVLMILRFRETANWPAFLLFLISALGLYLTHYTTVLFISALEVYLLIRLAARMENAKFVGGIDPQPAETSVFDLIGFVEEPSSFGPNQT